MGNLSTHLVDYFRLFFIITEVGNSKASSGVTLGNCFIMTKVGYSLEIKIDRCYCQWWWESIELLAECFLFFIRIYRIYIIYRKHTGGSERSLISN